MQEATVNVLAAEVRTLMIGARQVTLSVWKQLDLVSADEIIPFGRVSPGDGTYGLRVWHGPVVWIVGRHKDTGTLVRSQLPLNDFGMAEHVRSHKNGLTGPELHDKITEWKSLDLIVLAGLK